MLFVLITILGPISGAHMNPRSVAVAATRGELGWREAALYIAAQLIFGILGAWAAHIMFDLPAFQLSVKARTGLGQWLGEAIATFGLILTILGTVRHRQAWVPATVALYITAAYWFTSSTSFANPAITVARSLSDTFAGIGAATTCRHSLPPSCLAPGRGAARKVAVSRQSLAGVERPLCSGGRVPSVRGGPEAGGRDQPQGGEDTVEQQRLERAVGS